VLCFWFVFFRCWGVFFFFFFFLLTKIYLVALINLRQEGHDDEIQQGK